MRGPGPASAYVVAETSVDRKRVWRRRELGGVCHLLSSLETIYIKIINPGP